MVIEEHVTKYNSVALVVYGSQLSLGTAQVAM